jgi:hypothetical protein
MKPPFAGVVGLGLFLTVAAASPADSYKDAVLADKPFAYYRLGETANTQPVADEMGNNPGTYIRGPKTGTPGAIGTDHGNTAVSFPRRQSQYIKLTKFGNYGSSLSGGFSVEYWLKTADSIDHQMVFGTANGPGFITDFLADIAYGGKRKRFRLYCRDNHSNRFEADFYPTGKNTNLFDNKWHHIVHVYDSKAESLNAQVLLYIDGVQQTMTVGRKGGVPEFSNFDEVLTLGAMDLRGKEPDHLEGSLDEVAFYQAPLSAAQIMSHYQAAGSHEPWPFGH